MGYGAGLDCLQVDGRRVELAAVHLADTLEVVGARWRLSDEEVYDLVTTRVITTMPPLYGAGSLEMELRALKMWSYITRGFAQNADRLRLQQIIDSVTSFAPDPGLD